MLEFFSNVVFVCCQCIPYVFEEPFEVLFLPRERSLKPGNVEDVFWAIKVFYVTSPAFILSSTISTICFPLEITLSLEILVAQKTFRGSMHSKRDKEMKERALVCCKIARALRFRTQTCYIILTPNFISFFGRTSSIFSMSLSLKSIRFSPYLEYNSFFLFFLSEYASSCMPQYSM